MSGLGSKLNQMLS